MGHQVELNTGIAAVVPTWRLRDLLDNHPALKKERKYAEDAFFSSVAGGDDAFGVSSEESDSDNDHNHPDDF
jgi:hypothetical protein